MYIQHDLCQFWCFYHQTHIFLQICCTIIDVDYNACSGEALRSRCSESETVSLYNSGYITSPNYPDKYYSEIRTSGQVLHMYAASPNYPDKYYMDAECRSVVYQCMSLRTMNIISKYLLLIGRIATRSARCGLLMQTQ